MIRRKTKRRIEELQEENRKLRTAKLSDVSYLALGFKVVDLDRALEEMHIHSGADIDKREKLLEDKAKVMADTNRFYHEPRQYTIYTGPSR